MDALRSDLRALDRKIANLTVAVESGAALVPLVTKLQTRQAERDALLGAIGAAEAVGKAKLDRQAIKREVLAQVRNVADNADDEYRGWSTSAA